MDPHLEPANGAEPGAIPNFLRYQIFDKEEMDKAGKQDPLMNRNS